MKRRGGWVERFIGEGKEKIERKKNTLLVDILYCDRKRLSSILLIIIQSTGTFFFSLFSPFFIPSRVFPPRSYHTNILSLIIKTFEEHSYSFFLSHSTISFGERDDINPGGRTPSLMIRFIKATKKRPIGDTI